MGKTVQSVNLGGGGRKQKKAPDLDCKKNSLQHQFT